jgi:hypothetical protein
MMLHSKVVIVPALALASLPLALAAALSTSTSSNTALAAKDPCIKIAGKAFAPPADVLACMKSFPYSQALHDNVLTNIARVMDFFTFEPYYLHSPAPFQESTVNIRAELARIGNTKYPTDFDFNMDVYNFTNMLNDGHTRWRSDCYTASYQNILPTPVVSLSVDGVESLYVAPDAVEFISKLGSNYTDYFDSIGFDWQRLAGAKILTIEGMDAYDYVDHIAHTVSGNFLDHGIRVNSVYTSYRISNNTYSQRLGDLAGRSVPILTGLTMKLITVNSTKAETVRVPYLANLLGKPFKDGPSYWANNCAAKEDGTNGFDFKENPSLLPGVPAIKRARGDIIDKGPASGIDLPKEYQPSLPSTPGSKGVIKSYLLADGITGVMFVGSFSPDDFDAFMADTVSAVTALKSAGATRLLIDLTDNGGGYICLGQYLHRYLSGPSVTYAGFQSTNRGNALAQKIVANDIALGIDGFSSFYTPDNWAFLNGTQMPVDYNYMDPTEPLVVNGQKDRTSQRFHDTCELAFLQPLPDAPPFPLDQVKIVSNGWCASTCAMFSTLMFEEHQTEIAVFGGRPGQSIQYKGMAGNQVLEWPDLDSEIKTANLKNDPLAPPDLLVSGNFRHNWRTAWSTIDEKTPIAYRSELPTIQFPYTKETYNNPQALWEFAASKLF